MESGGALDIISTLSDFLLVLIISNLSFKEALRTSLLSRRWRLICRETRNVSFQEAVITQTYPAWVDEFDKRAEFVNYALNWVSNFTGGIVDTFELSFHRPIGYDVEVKTFINFAAAKHVKNLVLDFSDRLWVNRDEVAASFEDTMIQLPESFYHLTELVKLKLLACRFDASRLAVAGKVQFLYFGWMSLAMITSLLPKAPLLECLQIKNCWNVGLGAITGVNNRLMKLVLKNSVFAVQTTSLDLPSILIFKYAGRLHWFTLRNVNRGMDEVSLDFGHESQYHAGLGRNFCDLLCSLATAKAVTICQFCIQMIQDNVNPSKLRADMETRRLVLMTSLRPREFVGIRCMIKSCPYLETLTFQLVVGTPVQMERVQIDASTFWLEGILHPCLKNTLKNLEVWNFCGERHEMELLKNMIRMSRVLERVDLYKPMRLGATHLNRIQARADHVGTQFEAGSANLVISLH
ncbi:PREDICTED: F-box protein At3g62230-like [Camelina sativa]|uniref:F-box protein At3g62230-like n=1 Tax=Camelina sativa TaxID=90675 RepID=A0ABM0SZW9_CAMSA|nr:PREDICTED: F-box protein At3g62230-like [Camelina sativa]